MAVRLTMAGLIDRVNALCNNALNANLAFENQDVQDCLDRHSREVRYEELNALPTRLQGGSVLYTTFESSHRMWEGGTAYNGGSAGYSLVDSTWGTITPLSADLHMGRWTFQATANPSGFMQGPLRPVMITGFYYDIYGAAAELLLLRKTTMAEDFDFQTAEGLKYTRSQKLDMIEKVRQDFLAQSWASCGHMHRCDVTGY